MEKKMEFRELFSHFHLQSVNSLNLQLQMEFFMAQRFWKWQVEELIQAPISTTINMESGNIDI